MTTWRRRMAATAMAAGLLVSGLAAEMAGADEGTPSSNKEWEELSGMLSQIYGDWKDTAYDGLFSNQIPNTALLGNGDVGVASGGDAASKTFYISKSDFWTYGGSPLPIGGVTLAPTKEEEKMPVSLAQGKEASASSSHPDFPASRALSGGWSANSGYEGWVSNVGNEQSLFIDLGENTTFDRIILRHDAAARPAETANITKAFTIQASTQPDGGWVTCYETANNSDAVTDVKLDKPVTARYVWLDITEATQATTDDSKNNPRARIGQFELYNSAEQTLPDDYEPPVKTDFYEKQDILNAQVLTTMSMNDTPLSMKTYMAAGKNLLVTELTSAGSAALTLQAQVWAKADNGSCPVTASHTDQTAVVTRSTPNNHRSSSASYTSQAALALQVVGTKAEKTGSDKATAFVEFTLQPGQTVYLVTAVGGGGRSYDNQGSLLGTAPVDQADALLKEAADTASLKALLEAHTQWWKDYWLQSYISLDADSADLQTLQRYYYGAQYLFGCMANEDGIAPGLYGIWHTTDTPSWNSDYHLNYNFISTFYGAYSSNRAALTRSAIQAILDYLPAGEAAAQSVSELRKVDTDFVNYKIEKGDIDPEKGIEGAVLYPVGIGPYGVILDTSYHHQTLNASFSATMMIDYYDYTQDEEFLRDELYDYLKKCATFYESWLEKEDGKYVLYAGYNEGSWAINAAAELAMLKNVLQNVIEASEKLHLDADRRALWQEMLDGLADQPTATYEGKTVYALAEKEYTGGQWVDMVNPVPGDGNIIPMESAEPGGQLGYYSSEEELAIARSTIDVFAGRGAWGQNNNFPKIFPIAVNTRYPAETIVTQFARVIREKMVANLRISDNTHGAEKVGATQAINDMLVLSDQGVIKLFGNWLADKDAAFTRLRTDGAFLLSASYDGDKQEVSSASLYSEAGGTATVASPWTDMKVLDEAGKEVALTEGTAPNHEEERTYTFATEAGKTYTLIKGDKAQEEKPDGIHGDINRDKAVNTTDARLALQYAVGKFTLDDDQLAVGDVNADGRVDTTDARLILQYAVGKIDKFPVEQQTE